MNGQEWRDQLKQGDEVMVSGNNSYILSTVERTTAKQIIVNGTRFWKKNGRQAGGSIWHSVDIEMPTPDRRERAELGVLLRKAHVLRTKLYNRKLPKTRPELEALIAALRPFVEPPC